MSVSSTNLPEFDVIKEPYSLVHSLFDAASKDGRIENGDEEWGVGSEFAKRLLKSLPSTSSNGTAADGGNSPLLSRVPFLTRDALNRCRLESGSLVRWRCLIQDQFDPEYFVGVHELSSTRALSSNCSATSACSSSGSGCCGKSASLAPSKFCDVISGGGQRSYDTPRCKLMQRQPLYCVNIPGEAPWNIPWDGVDPVVTESSTDGGNGATSFSALDAATRLSSGQTQGESTAPVSRRRKRVVGGHPDKSDKDTAEIMGDRHERKEVHVSPSAVNSKQEVREYEVAKKKKTKSNVNRKKDQNKEAFSEEKSILPSLNLPVQGSKKQSLACIVKVYDECCGALCPERSQKTSEGVGENNESGNRKQMRSNMNNERKKTLSSKEMSYV